MTVEGTLGSLLVVQAVEANSTLDEVGLLGLAHQRPTRLRRVGLARVTESVAAAIGVAGNHAETCGESLDIVSVEKVVAERISKRAGKQGVEWFNLRKHATNLGDKLKLAGGGILKVQGRVPVVGLILGDTARSAITTTEVAEVGTGRETRRTGDGVGVGRVNARVDNGIKTSDVENARAFHTPEGVGASGEAQGKGNRLER